MKPLLRLPVFDKQPQPARLMSMDEYYQFVEMCARYLIDRDRDAVRKVRGAADVPFVLKQSPRSS